jgi:hypothetical protein
MDRVTTLHLMNHAVTHISQYEDGYKHDHFNTLKHQLAAAAFNLMMEFHFAHLSEELNG